MFAGLYVHVPLCAQCPQTRRECWISLKPGVSDDVSCHVGAENRILVLCRSNKPLLSSEPSLLPQDYLCKVSSFYYCVCKPLAAEKSLRIR